MPAKGEIEIVVQGEISGATIALTGLAQDKEAALNDQLDALTKAIGRQKSKSDLAEKLLAAEINAKMIADMPGQYQEAMRLRVEDRARMIAADEARHDASGRRGEYKMPPQFRGVLDQFDKETEVEKRKWDRKKADLEQDAQLIAAQISRLRAIIAGRDPTDFMGDAAAAA